ncbi:MAG: hypothetical protein HQ592_04215 [Planctomycetes bacterium]|nr:hypothetical protein [Planctomycetota bacterium]
MIGTILSERTGLWARGRGAPLISLVTVADAALIRHQLRALKNVGIDKLMLPAECPELREYLDNHHTEDVEITFGNNAGREPLLVLAANALPGRGLRRLLEYHATSDAQLTVAVPAHAGQPLGIYTVRHGTPLHSNPELLREADANRLDENADSFVLSDNSIRVRTVADYLEATRMLLATLRQNSRGLRCIDDGIWTDGTAFIDPDAHLTGDVLLSDNSSVAAGVTLVGPVVLGRGAMVCRNAHVESCVVWAGAAIGSNARLTHSLVTECFTIAPGAVFDHCVSIDRTGARRLPLDPSTYIVQYSPRGLEAETTHR